MLGFKGRKLVAYIWLSDRVKAFTSKAPQLHSTTFLKDPLWSNILPEGIIQQHQGYLPNNRVCRCGKFISQSFPYDLAFIKENQSIQSETINEKDK